MAWYRCGSSSIEHLFGLNDFIDNVYISSGDGSEIPYNGWSATDYILVTPGETLLLVSGDRWEGYNAWYDENKTFISTFSFFATGADYTTITVPNNAKYFRISNETGYKGRIIIWRE